MRKTLMLAVLVLSMLAMFGAPCRAETLDLPIFTPQRLALAVGADYATYSGASAPKFPVTKEFQAGVFAAYKMTPTLSLVAGSRYGMDSKQFDTKIGLRLLVWDGGK